MYLKVSLSWLAKARMRGDGPPYTLGPLCRGQQRASKAGRLSRPLAPLIPWSR
jgi:hypothetical protein